MIKSTLIILFSLLISTSAIAQNWVDEIRNNANTSREIMTEIRNQTNQQIGNPAPEISFTDLVSGDVSSLSDYAGQKVLVVFMRSTCSACIDQLPIVEDIEKSFDESQLKVIHISREDEATLHRFKSTYNVDGKIAKANDFANFGKPFQISVTPTSFLIDAEGIIKDAWIGVVPYHIFVQSIESES